jgi:hypothetical protein
MGSKRVTHVILQRISDPAWYEDEGSQSSSKVA